jgi:hypothetical protein
MTSLPPAGRGRQPDKDAPRRIPASQLLRHLPFSGFNPDRGDHGDDVDDEPGDLTPRHSPRGRMTATTRRCRPSASASRPRSPTRT